MGVWYPVVIAYPCKEATMSLFATQFSPAFFHRFTLSIPQLLNTNQVLNVSIFVLFATSTQLARAEIQNAHKKMWMCMKTYFQPLSVWAGCHSLKQPLTFVIHTERMHVTLHTLQALTHILCRFSVVRLRACACVCVHVCIRRWHWMKFKGPHAYALRCR